MSLIILTETHIASDHLIVDGVYNPTVTVDTATQKILFSPSNQFIVAVFGSSDTVKLSDSAIMDFLEILIDTLIKWKFTRKIHEVCIIDEELTTKVFKLVVDLNTQMFIVTKEHRFVIQYHELERVFYAKIADNVAVLGAASHIALGLLDGGMNLKEVFKTVSRMSNLVGEECSIYGLASLVPFKRKDS